MEIPRTHEAIEAQIRERQNKRKEIPVENNDKGVSNPVFTNKCSGLGAPLALLNDITQSEKDYDPFAYRRRPTIADREDEYRQKRRRMIISPERVDPVADDGSLVIDSEKNDQSEEVTALVKSVTNERRPMKFDRQQEKQDILQRFKESLSSINSRAELDALKRILAPLKPTLAAMKRRMNPKEE